MTRDRIDDVIHTLWQECEAQMGVDKRQTMHNAVIRCAFSQACFNKYGAMYGQGIYHIIAKVIGRHVSMIGQYVGTQQTIVIKTAYHPATKELTPKFEERLSKIESMEGINVEFVYGDWYVDGNLMHTEEVKKAIIEYASVNY